MKGEKEMFIVPFLICFPLVMAFLMFVIREKKLQAAIAYIGAAVIMAGAIVLFMQWLTNGSTRISLYGSEGMVDHLILAGELALMVLVTVLCFKYRKYWICLLSIIPTLAVAYYELTGPELKAMARVRIDSMTALMVLIIGIIGSLIVIYAIGYMDGYHKHYKDVEDRRYYFFMLLFAFLGAMFGFVLTDSLLWLILFWETTSVCSFMLIGYTRTEEAINNAFRALWMNLLGGCGLSAGVIVFGYMTNVGTLSGLVYQGMQNADDYALFAVSLIAFAALTKSAQLPFSTWLMGAMVAPTPSSALLHSATMVKAGIYILYRLAPAMGGTPTGTMVALIGGFTFLMASVMAIAQTDAKKVLAFSTISNLGLMVACAGIGKKETLWAGVFLMIFHAISKSLLFQDVGATENTTHSRDIESMHGLIYRVPKLAIFMFIGIAAMFLAPFGMLVSKWSALRAAVDERDIVVALLIAFGSATTAFYWTKWLGKIISPTHNVIHSEIKDITKPGENLSLTVHAVLMIALCIVFPFLSDTLVKGVVLDTYGSYAPVIPTMVLYSLVGIVVVVFLIPLIAWRIGKERKHNVKLAYMNGINTGTNTGFIDSFGNEKQLWMSNYYFENVCGEEKIMVPSQMVAIVAVIVMICMAIGGAL